jgi:hypothetical protein
MTVVVYRLEATTVSARSNNSIVAVSTTGKPQISEINDMENLTEALGWLFNYTAAKLPDESSPTFLIWDNSEGQSEHDWAVEAFHTLKSSVAFVLWFFSVNNYGNQDLSPQALPSEFHTIAAISKRSIQFVVDRRMFYLYISLQLVPIALGWVAFIWSMRNSRRQTKLSSFPLLDFVLKTSLDGVILPQEEVLNAEDESFIKFSDEVVVHLANGSSLKTDETTSECAA